MNETCRLPFCQCNVERAAVLRATDGERRREVRVEGPGEDEKRGSRAARDHGKVRVPDAETCLGLGTRLEIRDGVHISPDVPFYLRLNWKRRPGWEEKRRL